jgi:hypothetical protein
MTVIYAVVWTILAAWYVASQGCLAFNLASVIFVVAAYVLAQSVAAMRRFLPCVLLLIGLVPVAGLLQTGATIVALCFRGILMAIKEVF